MVPLVPLVPPALLLAVVLLVVLLAFQANSRR
jgi:hypothetical protein